MPSGEVPRTGWVSAGMDISEGGATNRPSSQAHVQSVHMTQTVRKSRTVAVWLPTTCAAKAHQSCCVCWGQLGLGAAPHLPSVCTDFLLLKKGGR